MFFGTPHGGADPRGMLQHAAQLVIQAIGYKVNEQIVNTLLPSSERLRELRDEFSPMAHEQQWAIHSFQEQLGMRALGWRKVYESVQFRPSFRLTLRIIRSWKIHRRILTFLESRSPSISGRTMWIYAASVVQKTSSIRKSMLPYDE